MRRMPTTGLSGSSAKTSGERLHARAKAAYACQRMTLGLHPVGVIAATLPSRSRRSQEGLQISRKDVNGGQLASQPPIGGGERRRTTTTPPHPQPSQHSNSAATAQRQPQPSTPPPTTTTGRSKEGEEHGARQENSTSRRVKIPAEDRNSGRYPGS